MAHTFRPADTSPEVFEFMIERWRTMTLADRAALVDALNRDVETLARAGIRAAHPEYSERETLRELTRRRYGSELADAAYGRHTR